MASGESFEIVVADDASDDATAEIARQAGATVVAVNYRQIAAVRNAGAKASRGDVLFFVDADTSISAGHVTGALAALGEGCAGGGAYAAIEGAIPWWGPLFIRIFSAFYFKAANLGAGAFLFTTRENFRVVGGFDEQFFAGEEIYFTQALKKLGAFKLLREPIVTSGRKLRMHSGRHILRSIFMLVVRGKKGVRTRDKLGIWYDGKRESKARHPVTGSAPG